MKTRQWKVGEATIICIVETTALTQLGGIFPQADEASIDRHRSWLAPHFIDDNNTFSLAVQAFIIEVNELRVVVDTCLGEHETQAAAMLANTSDDFLAKMSGAGYPPESITHVLCTHLHVDHIGWNTKLEKGQWVPTFPNARYLFTKDEYDHWHASETTMTTENFNDAILPIVDAGLADLVSANHRLNDTIRFLPTPGHSPGHVCVLIQSAGEQALITGDATHHPIQWAEPDWKMVADFDTAQAASSRRALLDQFTDSNTLIIGTHYPQPTAGYLRLAGEKLQFAVE